MPKLLWLSIGLLVSSTLNAASQKGPKELLVTLKFAPQEGVRAASVALPSSVLNRTLELRIEDGREVLDPKIIGDGTDDDDLPFPIKSRTDVPQFVDATIDALATAQTLKKGTPSDRVLQLRVTRFNVSERNKAVGSTYTAEAHWAYVLVDGAGTTLSEGASAGTATRYGRARSEGNCTEVLSDALKDAFVKMLSDSALQKAWASGAPQPSAQSPAASASIEERLKALDDLLNRGVITKEEHAARRAAILKEL
jgi:hypothetical protein